MWNRQLFYSMQNHPVVVLERRIITTMKDNIAVSQWRPTDPLQLFTSHVSFGLVTGEVQPELQVQGANRGEWLQHICLPSLEAWRQADVCFAEWAREATARAQGSTKTSVYSFPAHAPLLAAQVWTLTGNWLAHLPRHTNVDLVTTVILILIIPCYCHIRVHLLRSVTFVVLVQYVPLSYLSNDVQ